MPITRTLFAAALLVVTAAAATEAPAGILGDILSYVSGYPEDVQAQGYYSQYNANNGYQYQVTYHGPGANQQYPQSPANPYGQYASASPAQGVPQYEQTVPQGQVMADPGRGVRRTAVSPKPSRQHVAASQDRRAPQLQSRNPTTYRRPAPVPQQVSQPYSNSFPPQPYYGSYSPQQTQSTGSSYYASPYQYNNQGWFSGGFCPPGRA